MTYPKQQFHDRNHLWFAMTVLLAMLSTKAPCQGDTFADASVIRNHRVLVRTGTLDSYGRTLTTIDPWVSVNRNGLVAFSARTTRGDGRRVQNIYAFNSRMSGAVPYPLMAPGVELGNGSYTLEFPDSGDRPWQEFTPPVLNDSDVAVSRRRIDPTLFVNYLIGGIPEQQVQYPPMTYIEKWDATQSRPNSILVEGADPGIRALVTAPFHWFSHFDVYPMGSWPLGIDGRPTWENGLPAPFRPLGPNRWLAFQGPRNEAFPTMNNDGQVLFTGLGDDNQNYLSSPGRTRQQSLLTPEPRRPKAGGASFVTYRDQGPSIIKGSVTNPASFTTIAASPTFLNIGLSPGISDDGSAVVFAADRAAASSSETAGPGIWLHTTGTPIRVVGTRVPYDPRNAYVYDPGVDYRDTDLDGQYEPGEPLRSVVKSILKDERICVISSAEGGNTVYEVLFVALDSRDRKTIFRSRVQPGNAQYRASDPMPILSVGDTVSGVGVVSNVALFDSLTPNNESLDGEAVCWVEAGAAQAVVELRARYEPLIFVPGIGATMIVDGTGDVKWIDAGTFYDNSYAHDLRDMAMGMPVVPDTIYHDAYRDLMSFIQFKLGYRMLDMSRTNRETWTNDSRLSYSAFTFPYDWRFSNATSAESLKQLVDRVVQYYKQGMGSETEPSFSVIAHSMGGLVSRRYLLDHRTDHRVRTMTTIGSPFLGASKTAHILATGEWFRHWLLGWLPVDAIREVAQDYPGAHELISSSAYFDLGGRPFREEGWDVDGNNVAWETYNSQQYFTYVDGLSVRTDPGSHSKEFHKASGQDDWSSSGLGVKYLHLVGNQAEDQTILAVVARHTAWFALPDALGGREVMADDVLVTETGSGDGTVPLLSATRRTGSTDLNAPDAVLSVFNGGSDYAGQDGSVEHTELCKNTATLRNASSMIRWETPFEVSPTVTGPITPQIQVDAQGLGNRLTVIDSSGRRTEDVGEGVSEPPGVTRSTGSPSAITYRMPANQSYALEFRTMTGPFGLDMIRRNALGVPNRVVRFHDVSLPPDTFIRIAISEDGSVLALVDLDRNGTPELPLNPDYNISGPEAADIDPPVLRAQAAGQNITLQATDTAGVDDLYYSLNGTTAYPYTGPIPFDPSEQVFVYALAVDGVGNRSALLKMALSPPIRIIGSIDLQDFVGMPPAVVLEFRRPGSMASLGTARVSLNTDGTFETHVVLPPGAYQVLVKSEHWLRRAVSASANTIEMTPITCSLLNGDCTGDNVIDVQDFTYMSRSYGSVRGDASYDSGSDLNGDGQVALTDYQILARNFGLDGD